MGLVVVSVRLVPLMAALPFTTMEPGVKPLPNPMPPPPEELTVKPLINVALCPSESVTTILCPPKTAFAAIERVAVILVAEL